jgi:hypothetical protein
VSSIPVIDTVRGVALPWSSTTRSPWFNGLYAKVKPYAAWPADSCYVNLAHESQTPFASLADRSLRVFGTEAGLCFEMDITTRQLGLRNMLASIPELGCTVQMHVLESKDDGPVCEIAECAIAHITLGHREDMAFSEASAWLESAVPQHMLNTRRRWIIAKNSMEAPRPKPGASRPALTDWAAMAAASGKPDTRLLAKAYARFGNQIMGMPKAYFFAHLRRMEAEGRL